MSLTKMVDGVSVILTPEEEAAVRAEWEKWDIEYAATGYLTKRQTAYPAIPDQLDAIWKQLQSTPELLLPEVKVVSNQILQVKEDYPKPEEVIKI